MKSMRLMKAIGSADDELLEAYKKDKTKSMKKRPWVKWSALAACLCIIVAGALTIPGLLTNNAPAPQEDSSIGEKSDEERPVGDKSLVINGSGYDGSAASYVIPEAGTTLFSIEVRDAIEDYRGTDARLFLGININTASEEMLTDNSEEMRLETERLASLGYEIGWYESWTYQGQGEKVPCTYLYGLFTIEELESFAASPDYGYSFYFRHNGDGSAVEYTGMGDIINSGTENAGTPLAPAELTEPEAYAAIGAFLPGAAPDGFVFESAYHSDGTIFVLWTNSGYGELRWTVSDMTQADAARLTAAADTENYDLSLYPVPRADSVPEELREIVDNPIFDIAELTQEVVDMRAYNSDDPGDEGVRLHFSVRYGDMLVEISAKGVSAEWVYETLIGIANEQN